MGQLCDGPLLLANESSAFTASPEQPVPWLVYRPAYDRRWADDLRRAATSEAAWKEVRRIQGLGFTSYAHLIERRARERNWRLRWFDSTEGLYLALGAVPGPVSTALVPSPGPVPAENVRSMYRRHARFAA
ncbi:hypothetical protein [Streptomyces lutosisoli]|uniref:Uncharacterized protein n=1 Tax=Streptomyces lutosisoli TaxID=2665721 RepID=A0ABW2VYH0_9ACTN